MCALSIKDNLRINLKETILTAENLSSICRTCFCRDNLQRFDELYIEDLCLSDIFSQIVSVGPEECKIFPNQLCLECLSKLSQVYLFIEQIKEHELILKTVYYSQGTVVVCESGIKEPDTKISNENTINSEEQDMILKNEDANEKYQADHDIFEHSYFAKWDSNNISDNVSMENTNIKNIKESKKRISKKKKVYECDICQKRFSFPQNLKRHKNCIHDGHNYQCPLCDKVFTRSATRDEHVRVHTGEKPYVCIHCGKRFNRAISHFQHMQLHKYHQGKIVRSKCNANKFRVRFRCEICNKFLLTKYSLQTHMFIHTNEKPNLCNVCGKGLITKAALESHMKTHTGEKPYTCSICEKTFSHSSGLNTHKLIHTGHKPHKCNICAKSFVQTSHLKTHMRTHTDEKPFVCSFCGKAFAQNFNLRVHVRIHTGETPYVCKICGSGYHNSSQLKNHAKVHINKNINNIHDINTSENDRTEFTITNK